jgi:hypothetical protein
MTKKKEKKIKEKAFNNWKHNAIHLTFPNGNKLSTIWGYCTYSDNHDRPDLDRSINVSLPFKTFMDSNTVEIMVLKAPDKLMKRIQKKYDFADNSVCGYLTMKQWLDVVKMLSK